MRLTDGIRRYARLGLAGASAFSLLATPAFALSSGDVVSAGSIWLETTIAVAMVFVTAMAFSLQIARGYFIRILNKFTLRLGADIWWLAYVLIRDALIFLSFIMGLMVFLPGTFLDYPLAVPFMPASIVLFGLALLTKLYFDADDNRNAFRAVTLLVFGGTMLWIFGAIFVLETPLALPTLPAGVSTETGFWAWVYNTFSSTENINLAMMSFQAGLAALGVIAVFGFAHPLLHSRVRKARPAAQPAVAPTPVAIPATRAVIGREEKPETNSQTPAPPDSFRAKGYDRVDYIA